MLELEAPPLALPPSPRIGIRAESESSLGYLLIVAEAGVTLYLMAFCWLLFPGRTMAACEKLDPWSKVLFIIDASLCCITVPDGGSAIEPGYLAY